MGIVFDDGETSTAAPVTESVHVDAFILYNGKVVYHVNDERDKDVAGNMTYPNTPGNSISVDLRHPRLRLLNQSQVPISLCTSHWTRVHQVRMSVK